MYVMCFVFLVLGLDVVTSESLYGYEAAEYKEDSTLSTARPSEADRKVVLPDTSAFLSSPAHFGPSISFPKYNNYMADPNRFDPHSKIQVPLNTLGITPLVQGELNIKNSLNNRKAVLSYVQYKELGALLPQKYVYVRRLINNRYHTFNNAIFFYITDSTTRCQLDGAWK